ncbi:MAG: carbon-nitrogen hydrolase family protein [Marinilabiliaceae bacterium]
MKVSAIAMESIPGDLPANLNTLESHLSEAAKTDTELCVFPELNLSGAFASIDDVDAFLKHNPDPTSTCRHLSEKYHLSYTAGWPVAENGRFYLVQFLFEKGMLAGSHKKTHLTGKEARIFDPGNKMNVFACNDTVIGMQLCLESHFPEISTIQARKGAQILAIGFASPRESGTKKMERFLRFLPARAYDNNCFVVAANQSGPTPWGKPFAGISLICSPKGEVLDQSTQHGQEATSELDMNQIEKIKQSDMGWFNGMKRELILPGTGNPPDGRD